MTTAAKKAYMKKYVAENWERIKKQRREHYLRSGRKRRQYGELSRFRKALWSSHSIAKKNGFAGCTATAAEIASSFSGKCHACGISEDQKKRRLSLDHCHKTGKFRGWLCSNCNTSAGLLGDSPQLVLQLVEYLRRFEGSN